MEDLTMLEYAERLLKEVRKLQSDSESIVLNGTIANMERYRFMMGRLEGLKLVEEMIKESLNSNPDDLDF
jgi:hypothetical protein